VAPPINKGTFMPILSISLATWIISSREGVISPDNPIMSAKDYITNPMSAEQATINP
jgi:hypothetical protein